ncbi:unnamed protein product [Cunninghamella blakesleeana]
MKIQCLDHDPKNQNTFLITIKQHTILINCGLETRLFKQKQDDNNNEVQQQNQNPINNDNDSHSYINTLDFMLSNFNSSIKNLPETSSRVSTQYLEQINKNKMYQDGYDDNNKAFFRLKNMDTIDVKNIDLILITSYEESLGLPYLTEYMGYKGKIIATEPTIEFGRQRMVELIHFHSNLGSHISPDTSPYDYLKRVYEDHDDWRLIYTLKDVSSCIEKILPVRYKEKLSLFSTLDITPYSAGYSLGSSHWLIETSMKKIVVLGNGSLRTELHPSDFDTSIFYSADVILVSGIIATANRMDTTRLFDLQMNKLLGNIASTLGARQNVILPIRITSGLLYDLIWMIKSHLYTVGMEIGSERHQIPIYVLSPVAEQSLQYANICGEWMTNEYQEQLWKPEMPLPHGELLKTGALTTFTDITQLKMKSFQQPCIIFCGDHQCLSKGPTQWFLQKWNNSNDNQNPLCILTDAFELQQQNNIDSAITVIHTPLDVRLNYSSLFDLLQLHWRDNDGTGNENGRLKHLILPKPFDSSSVDLPDSSLFSNNNNVQMTYYSSGEMINIDIDIQWEQIMISNKLAKDMKLKPIPWTPSDGKIITMTPISGQVYIYNNQLLLKESNSLSLNRSNTDWLLSNTSNNLPLNDQQQIDVQTILLKLHKVGIANIDIQIEENDEKLTITIFNEANINIYQDKIVIKSSNEQLRMLIIKAFGHSG